MNAILFCLVIASTAYTVRCSDTWWGSGCEPKEQFCLLPSDSGPCYGNFDSYYYDWKSGTCEEFVYGGCQGNENNFKTKEECMKKCCKKPPQEKDVCKLPKETGPCRAAIPRFYFNSETRSCESFTYGGCRGNGNNFKDKEECVKNCGALQVKQKCKLPPKSGKGKCTCTRYYYNYKSGTCEKFTYGGRRSNGNNFKTEDDCLKTCIICPPNSKYAKAGPACEGCGIRCLAIIEKPNCYCKTGYGRQNPSDICTKCPSPRN